jgi:hypothetical protein
LQFGAAAGSVNASGAASLHALARREMKNPPARLLHIGLLSLLSGNAWAEEPRRVGEPDVLRESAEVVAVADAFDGSDYFDAHIAIGLLQSWKLATITRETQLGQAQFSSGGFTANNLEIARYVETTTRLVTRIDVGLFREVSVFGRMPVVLANDRHLDGLGDSAQNQNLVLQGAPGERLFSLPFRAPTRSGPEYMAIGLRFSPMSQLRDVSKPTWTIAVEGRFSVGEPLHACNGAPAKGQRVCADPGDVDRDGLAGENDLEASAFNSRGAGMSRGTSALAFESYLAKRLRFLEPYVGIEGLFEFQNDDSDFGRTDVQGALVNHPPFEGSIAVGLAIFPWEAVERFQRLEVDVRFQGTYRSEGRDYSELFDALGSSDAASLREPKFSEYRDNVVNGSVDAATPSVVDENSEKVYMSGITDVQQHGIYKLSARASWLAGQYLKFGLGAAGGWVQGHTLTADQPCNPNLQSDLGNAGPCRNVDGSAGNGLLTASGIPNANYREVINTAGRRFRVNSALLFDAWVHATLLF